jgi:adenine nucleotide transporter 17|tara:strand:+ start:1303 stop:2670 length:1368 start_codon:yes stop_codon:yes gene_type:complete
MKTFSQFSRSTFERKSRAKSSMSSSSSYKNRVEGISGAIAGLLALLATYPLITLNTRQHVREKTKKKTKTTTGKEVDFEDDEDVEKKKEKTKSGEKPRVRLLLPMLSSKTRDEEDEDEDDSTTQTKLEKLKKLYVGVKPASIGTVCSQGVYYYWFSVFNGEYLRAKRQRLLGQQQQEQQVFLTPIESLLTASLAGCVNVGLTLPIWTVVAKMQVVSKTSSNRGRSIDEEKYDESESEEEEAHKWSAVKKKKGGVSSSVDATRRKRRDEAKALGFWTVAKEVYDTSGVAGFYGGLSASLIMVTNPALQFAIYETLRQKQRGNSNSRNSSTNTISALDAFFLGATAKIGATLATYPMLVIKSRLQVGRRGVVGTTKKNSIKADGKNGNNSKEYDGIVDCVKDLYTNEGGFFAFYDGLTTKLSQTALCAALMFSSKEEISRRVDEAAVRILQRYARMK